VISQAKMTFGSFVKSVGASLITWQWAKQLLSWLIISAGTMSECAFVLASLWICINASVHSFVLMVLSQQETQVLVDLAATAYVGLPELILPLAVVTTLGHVRRAFYDKSDYTAYIWAFLFAVPTALFLTLSVCTLGFSIANAAFQLPMPLIIARGVAGYWYALTSLLYVQLGKPQEVDRLQAVRNEKDFEIVQLRNELQARIDQLQRENGDLRKELDTNRALLHDTIMRNAELQNTVNKSSEAALDAYSEECKTWLRSGIKTATVDEISRYTGHSKRKISNAIERGNLAVSPRNRDLVLINGPSNSLLRWLEMNPPKVDDAPRFRVVNGDYSGE
jgi:hypothetical protein